MAVSTPLQPRPVQTPARRLFPLDVTRRGTIPQLPALDGLRAIAVLLVIFYHLGWTSVPGGFLGVEVFFVVSGYLITSLIVTELNEHGYLDLGGFWARRLRRLMPALLLLLGVLALVTPIVAPDGVSRLRSDLPASLLYLANWWQIFGDRSYFEASAAPDLLQHLWSLAIEEQFYVVWPPLVAALYTRLWRRRWLLPVISASGAAASVLAMQLIYSPDRDSSRVYFGTDTRASALLIGATLAFLWSPDVSKRHINPPPITADVVGGIAAVALLLAVARYNGFDPPVYEGGFLIVSLATAVLIVAGTTGSTVIGALLSGRTLRAIGARSYGLYLWHWPIFQLTRPGSDVSIEGWQLTALRLALLVVAAEASWRLVERPLRRPRVSARGTAARRYRRAEVAILISLPLLFVPYIAGANPAPSELDTVMPAGPDTSSGTAAPPGPSSSTAITDGVAAGTTTPETDPVSTTVVAGGTEVTTVPDVSSPPATTVAPLTPAGQVAPTAGNNVLVIGDSVMLGAAPKVMALLPAADVDTAVARQLRDADQILGDLRAAGRMRPIVVVHLGNNGSATSDQLERMMTQLDGAERVVLINAHATRAWRDTVNDRLDELAAGRSNVRVLDWKSVVESEDGLVGSDSVHLTPAGATRLADLITAAVSAS